jgi:hypothetical protein
MTGKSDVFLGLKIHFQFIFSIKTPNKPLWNWKKKLSYKKGPKNTKPIR